MSDHFVLAESLKEQGVPFAIATVVRAESPTSAKAGDKAIITATGMVEGWVGGSCAEPTVLEEAKAALQDGVCRLIHISPEEELPPSRQGLRFVPMTCSSGGALEIYIEPHLVAPHLLVFGNSPVAAALAELGALLKYRVTVVDLTNRPPMAGGFRVIKSLAELASIGAGPKYAVVATHSVFDEEALVGASKLAPDYIGLVASRRRAATVRERLVAMGVAAADVENIRAPAGVDIGAVSAEEIALSIMSEIVRVRRAKVPKVANAEPMVSGCCSHAAREDEVAAEVKAAPVEAILLAAGESTRMGKNKLLLPVGGVPLVRKSAETLLGGGFAKVIVVLGHEAEQIRAALDGLDLELVVNDNYREGQATSVRAGLGAVSKDVEGVMICLSDQPDLTREDISEIKQAFLARPSGSVLVPMHKGQRGNPIVLDRHGLETILSRGGNFACRQFTTHHADVVYAYEMRTDHVIKDLDRPEDYANLTAAEARLHG